MFKKKFLKRVDFNLMNWLFFLSAAIIFISLAIGLIIGGKTIFTLNQKIAAQGAQKAAQKPAELDLVIIGVSNCEECYEIKPMIEALKQNNVKINTEKTIESGSAEGQELIKKFNINKLPTLLLTGELEKDANLKNLWLKIGEIKDNTFVLRQVGAPYVLVESGEVVGQVRLIMLTDKSCQECYNVNEHQQILKQFGFPLTNTQTIDSGSAAGQKLISQYQIKLLPTIILTGELEVYPTLKAIWPQVGTVEKDGAYIFRVGVKTMGIYKDLNTNQVVKPTVPANKSDSN